MICLLCRIYAPGEQIGVFKFILNLKSIWVELAETLITIRRDGGVTQKQLATNNQTNKNKQYARKKTQI